MTATIGGGRGGWYIHGIKDNDMLAMIKSTKDLKTVFSQLIERADVMCGSSHGNGVGEERRRQSGKGATHVFHLGTLCCDVLCFVFV